MNYYLFALVCMVGVIAILGFFSIIIYLSGLFFSRPEKSGKGESGASIGVERGEKMGLKERDEEELRKVAAVAAVVAMLGERGKRSTMVKKAKPPAKKRYPSPWMQVRE